MAKEADSPGTEAIAAADDFDIAIRGFAFPLNIYARLLELREGRVDYLHYGIFESPDEPVLAAQERASAQLWQALPPPCRLLEVGIGLGTTLSRLKAAGYQARGITPDASQVDFARQRHGSDLPVAVCRLEDFNQGAGEWQAMLFQESAQYIDPMALFEAAQRLLCEGPATLVVMDEFALQRSADGHEGLHQIDHFCALASRMGWRLVQRTELSRQAAPTLDYLLRHTTELQQRLMEDLDVTPDQMAGLDASNRRYQRHYRNGVYGYALLRFERDSRPAQHLLQVVPEHEAAARALFSAVFGHSMSAAHWQWKYGEGRGRAIGLLRDGRLLTHYGGVSRRISYFGAPALACQVCDVMVSPEANTALHRRGPIYQTAASFLEHEIGWGLPHRVGFGFPTDRAFAVAHRQGLYDAVDSVVCASWPASDKPHAARCSQELVAGHGQALHEGERLAIDGLWQRMAAALPQVMVGVRDADWVQHRYLMHPSFRYELRLLRHAWTRQPIGLLVSRSHEQHLEVLDLVGAPANFNELITLARQQAAAQGLQRVECWITQSQLSCVSSIDADQCTVTPMNITVPANAHTPGPAIEELRDRWFLMAGDTDFR
jgi:hypothetical protein